MTGLIKATPATQTAPPPNNVTKGGAKSRSVAGALSAWSVCEPLLVYLGKKKRKKKRMSEFVVVNLLLYIYWLLEGKIYIIVLFNTTTDVDVVHIIPFCIHSNWPFCRGITKMQSQLKCLCSFALQKHTHRSLLAILEWKVHADTNSS